MSLSFSLSFFLSFSLSFCLCLLAPQALLLVANCVDSNADCSRLVVDGWLELELREPDGALKVLSSALSLRADWERLLQARIGQCHGQGLGQGLGQGQGQGRGLESGQGASGAGGGSRKEMDKLSEGLVRFMLYTEVRTNRMHNI